MGVFSNKEIWKALEEEHAVCFPLNDAHVRGSSIDLTLGRFYYVCDESTQRFFYNPFDPVDVERYFKGPFEAAPWRNESHRVLTGVPADHPIILIQPRTRILAHSHEFVGIHPPGTTEMRARSSWGRNGIAVCLCAGWGDPGYINRWTMEIHNFNDEAVPLPVGERVAQMIFHSTGHVDGHYGSDGKYQAGTTLDEVVASWEPSAMLPRSYKDTRMAPLDDSPAAFGDYKHDMWRLRKAASHRFRDEVDEAIHRR